LLEAYEAGTAVTKADYEAALPDLRVQLLNAQFDLGRSDFQVLLLLAGDDFAGVDELLDVLHEWLDARYLDTHVFLQPTDEERERPLFFRYWRALPRRGRIGIHMGAWPVGAVRDRVSGYLDDAGYAARIQHGRRFEEALVDDGTLLLKIWVHLSRKERARRLEKARRDPGRARVPEEAWRIWEREDEAIEAARDLLSETDTAAAPWVVVDGTDDRHRNLTVARVLADSMTARLGAPAPQPRVPPLAPVPDALALVDLGERIEREEYKKRQRKLQQRVWELSRRAREAGVASVLVFEGWDAAGKGGCIRRITRPLEARDHRLVPVAAPSEEELAHHYLWRFWRELPRAGRMLIFDRSWYGRVLVERVEGLAREDEWRRAYEEIRDFEEQLTEHGMPVVKFWLHIEREEQLSRFRERERTPYKKYKITDEDYRNREHWDDYTAAANEMIARTSTANAPWHLIAATDKRHARIRVLEETCAALERALEGK
jgi:polyphosphate:AMP phosphotransferase